MVFFSSRYKRDVGCDDARRWFFVFDHANARSGFDMGARTARNKLKDQVGLISLKTVFFF